MDVPDGTAPVLAQMTALFEQEHASIFAVQDVGPRADPAIRHRQYLDIP